MLLDEPFGALDPITRDDLRVEVRALQRSLGFTTILVTHDMTEALLLADRIVVMDAGRVLQVGTPRELLAAPADDTVARLLAAPRRQTEALEALLSGA
jgi:osmoprotectant transport system ATP-binding protein